MAEALVNPAVRVAALRKRYGKLLALETVDLSVGSGEAFGLVGANGAGKTTLLHLLAGSLRPTAGRVVWRGRDVTRRGPVHRARSGIARSFQTPTILPSLSTVDNLMLGAWPRAGRSYDRALELARSLGLADCAQTPAGTLSHGQRRLLDIGIALAGAPELLLLDEPAAGLDGDDLDRLLALLDALPTTMAVLLVEHRGEVVEAIASTVSVLDQGRLASTVEVPGAVR
jgi:branched-chain amino acid transport system ATP-binding protein